MTVLGSIILAIIGLAVSLISIIKESSEKENSGWKKKFKWSNILAVLYILVFIGSILMFIFQGQEEVEQELRDIKITKTIDKIDSSINKQIDSINLFITSLEDLKLKINEVEKKTVEALTERENSLVEFRKISKQLAQKSKNEELSLAAKSPKVTIIGSDIYFASLDSVSNTLKARLRNMGTRTADKVKVNSMVIFADSSGKLDRHFVVLDEDDLGMTIYPNGDAQHFFTLSCGIFDRDDIDNNFAYGVFIFDITYEDLILNNKSFKRMSFEWVPYIKGIYQYAGKFNTQINNYLVKNKITEFKQL